MLSHTGLKVISEAKHTGKIIHGKPEEKHTKKHGKSNQFV